MMKDEKNKGYKNNYKKYIYIKFIYELLHILYYYIVKYSFNFLIFGVYFLELLYILFNYF